MTKSKPLALLDRGVSVRVEDEAQRFCLSEYRAEPRYVLLGEPGSGKSRAFEQEAREAGTVVVPARRFVGGKWPAGAIAFIDALEEYRIGEAGVDRLESLIEALENAGYARWRIACRAISLPPSDARRIADALAAQVDCAGIVAAVFDLFRDTRLETSAQAIAWGIVNSFHHEAQKLDRLEDSLSRDLGEMARSPDPSEVFNAELEELQLRCQTVQEQARAIECMRDYAAEMYRAQSGRPWSAARGSKVSSATTASQIAAADFMKARANQARERYLPTGPLVVFSGGQEWHDWRMIWDRLDQIKARVPTMTLCTTAQRKGADAIAAAWAAKAGVPLVAFTPDSRFGRRAGFLRNERLANLKPVEAIVCQGSGLQANLLDVLKGAGVPTHAFRADAQSKEAPARMNA